MAPKEKTERQIKPAHSNPTVYSLSFSQRWGMKDIQEDITQFHAVWYNFAILSINKTNASCTFQQYPLSSYLWTVSNPWNNLVTRSASVLHRTVDTESCIGFKDHCTAWPTAAGTKIYRPTGNSREPRTSTSASAVWRSTAEASASGTFILDIFWPCQSTEYNCGIVGQYLPLVACLQAPTFTLREMDFRIGSADATTLLNF
jgi:hypothetical protein